MKNTIIRLCAVLLLSAASATKAVLPFEATATTTDTSGISLSASGSNFFDFIDSLTKTQGQFQLLNNHPYIGNMTFLGVKDAIGFATNTNGTAMTITLKPTGFNRTFTGATKADVDNALEDFFKKDGAQTIADFLKAIAKESAIAVTDGNPNAATALAASATFTGQGFTNADELADGSDTSAGASKPKFGGISFGLNAGKFEAGVFKGTTYDLSGTLLSFGGDRVRLLVPFNFNYLKLDGGSEVGGGGVGVALPIRFRQMNKDEAWNWRVTPTASMSVRGSLDLASLSPLWQAGVVNTLDYRATSKLVVSVVNQFTVHKSIGFAYDDLDFDPKIDQQILKNGLRFTTPFSRRVIWDGFLVDTRFLKDAAVDQFWSLGTSLAFRVTQKWNIVLGANYDTGDDFKAYSAGLSSAWKW